MERNKEIFITTVSKEDYNNLSEREKSIYNAGISDANTFGVPEIFLTIVTFIAGVLIGALFYENIIK